MTKFSLNQAVAWRSSNTSKTGVVVAVVPPKVNPNQCGFKVDAGSTYRDHETYIIRGGRIGGKQNTIYWPLVSLLASADSLNAKELEWCRENIATIRKLMAEES